jgi:hypothetical protein
MSDELQIILTNHLGSIMFVPVGVYRVCYRIISLQGAKASNCFGTPHNPQVLHSMNKQLLL